MTTPPSPPSSTPPPEVVTFWNSVRSTLAILGQGARAFAEEKVKELLQGYHFPNMPETVAQSLAHKTLVVVPPQSQLETELDLWIDEPGITPAEKTNRQTAKACIIGCFTKKGPNLDLKNLALTSLPGVIAHLTSVRTIDLSGNKLSKFPEGFEKLTELTELNISNNQFITLPPELGIFHKLTSLDISQNPIVTSGQLKWCSSLNFPELRELKVDPTTPLPPAMRERTDLGPSVIENSLALWASTGSLTENRQEAQRRILAALRAQNHTELDLSHLSLSSLPKCISRLQTLHTLNLSGNALTALPKEIESLTSLQALDVSKNQISAIPVWISNFSALQLLNFSSNRVSDLPSQMKNLKNLNSLNLHNNQISQIPAWIKDLSNLGSLDLSNNKIRLIEQLGAEALASMINRTTNNAARDEDKQRPLNLLNLDHNQLKTLPAALVEASNQILQVNHNTIEFFIRSKIPSLLFPKKSIKPTAAVSSKATASAEGTVPKFFNVTTITIPTSAEELKSPHFAENNPNTHYLKFDKDNTVEKEDRSYKPRTLPAEKPVSADTRTPASTSATPRTRPRRARDFPPLPPTPQKPTQTQIVQEAPLFPSAFTDSGGQIYLKSLDQHMSNTATQKKKLQTQVPTQTPTHPEPKQITPQQTTIPIPPQPTSAPEKTAQSPETTRLATSTQPNTATNYVPPHLRKKTTAPSPTVNQNNPPKQRRQLTKKEMVSQRPHPPTKPKV